MREENRPGRSLYVIVTGEWSQWGALPPSRLSARYVQFLHPLPYLNIRVTNNAVFLFMSTFLKVDKKKTFGFHELSTRLNDFLFALLHACDRILTPNYQLLIRNLSKYILLLYFYSLCLLLCILLVRLVILKRIRFILY